MVSALKRLFKVSFIFLIAFSFGLFLLRNLGFREKIIKKEIPFLNEDLFIILQGGRSDLAPSHSEKALKMALKSSSTLISIDIIYDLKRTQWVLSSQDQRGLYKAHPPARHPSRPHSKNSTTMNPKNSNLSLKEFLSFMPLERPFLLHLHTFNTKELGILITVIENERPVIIESFFSKTLKYLRGLKPNWLYVSHSSSLIQLLFMTSLFIEPFHRFKSDFFILSKENHFPSRLIREIKRRKRKIILKVSSMKDFESFSYKDSLNGILIENAKDFLASCSSFSSLTIQDLRSSCSSNSNI